MTPLGLSLQQMDESRRLGGLLLEALGFGPRLTPSRVAYAAPGVRLLEYLQNPPDAPALLLIPAPIKLAYIWDIAPDASVVQRALQAGFRVYLMAWQQPGPEESGLGLDAYADRLIRECLDHIQASTGDGRAFLAGHSLGGIFAGIFSALHADRVRGLVLLESPMEFQDHGGPLPELMERSPPPDWLTGMVGNVPGVVLNTAAVLAAPETFVGERLMDWWRSSVHLESAERHLQVMRWTLDEFTMPARLFEDVGGLLYRDNLFIRGQLSVNGRRVLPENVIAPLVSIVDPESRIVPPRSMLRFHEVVSSQERRVLYYPGDVGVALQHVGVLVGRNAHRSIWPPITRWLHARAESQCSIHRVAG